MSGNREHEGRAVSDLFSKRGISETDVWHAADALQLEGARPTIERARLRSVMAR